MSIRSTTCARSTRRVKDEDHRDGAEPWPDGRKGAAESTMRIEDEFRVGVAVAEAWSVLLDVERIAPCMPGAQLQEVEGDEYRGVVKVKVGPITAQYKGKANFLEKDDSGHKVVLRAEGRDTRGQGNANATITATLVPDGNCTKVT